MSDRIKSIDYLNSLVRERDMDRYLSILLSPHTFKQSLLALAAFNAELGHIIHATNEPMLAAIRYQWWRDAVGGGVPDGDHKTGFETKETSKTGNPVADEVLKTVKRHDLPLRVIYNLIDGYEALHNGEANKFSLDACAVEAPLYELMALVLGCQPDDQLTRVCGSAARALEAAKTNNNSNARANLRECIDGLQELPACVFPAFLPLSLVGYYLNNHPETPYRQLNRIWTLWRAHRKHSLN